MVANKTKTLSALQKRLIKGLEVLPEDISLCLLNGKKVPQGKDWQNRPYSKAEVVQAIAQGIELENSSGKKYSFYPQGYGLMAGYPISVNGEKRYLLVLDQDGPSAKQLIEEMSGGEITPTVKTTSGRNDRCHRIYYVGEEYASHLHTRKIKTGELGEDGKLEHVEFLWLGTQAVLPPSVHPTTGCYHYLDCSAFDLSAIAHAPIWVIEKMLRETQETPLPNTQSQKQENWTDIDWALSYLNALSSYRADDYDDWLAVGMALQSVDDCLLTDWDNWSRQSSKYKSGDCEKKCKSFKSQGIAIGTLAHMAKQDGWRSPFADKHTGRNFSGGSGGNGGDGGDSGDRGKVLKHRVFDPLAIEQITEKIDELIAQGVSGSYLTGQLNRLAVASQCYIGELRKFYYERLGEADLEIERQNNRTEVENLLQLGDQSLNLDDYLPEDLANPLSLWCEWLSIRPEVTLTALLAGASSLHKVGTELVIHRNQNFRVPPTIFAALVSESGQRKSPIFSNIIYQPLGQLRKEKIDAYNAAMEDYEAAMQAWEQSENKGEKPRKPKEPTLYYFTNTTGEAIPVQATKAPEKALLALIDELSGLLRSENSYRNGRGSDRQDLLSYFDGTGQTGLRASGVKTDVERIYLSIYGTIQPAILKGHMADCSDPDGQWARFLFVNQPTVAATLSDDDGQAVQIRDRIADFYRKIDRLPEMEYRLSREAFERYQPVYNQLERLRVTHPKPGMRAVYSKMEGYIGRLAINLHVLWEIAAGKACPSQEISLRILEMAIALAKFFIGQVKIIHAHSDNDELAPHIIKLIELSKRLDSNGVNGWIKAKQYQDMFSKKQRPSAQQARDWMLEAVTLGYGCTRGSGNRLEYHWNCGNKNPNKNPPPSNNLGNLGNTWGTLGETLPQPEPIGNKGVEDNLGNLGNVTPPFRNSEEINLYPSTEDKVGESKIYLEGGYIPQPSPSHPQEPPTVEESSDSDLGNNLGNPSPTLPQVPQVCDSSAVACVTVEPVVEQTTQLPQITPKAQSPQSEQKLDNYLESLPTPSEKNLVDQQAICASQQRFAIAQPESKPEANQENLATLPIYQRSDGGFEISQKLRKFHYIGRRFAPRFTDLEGNELLVTAEMTLVETRRSVKPEYAFVTLEGIECDEQGIRLENLKEIEQ